MPASWAKGPRVRMTAVVPFFPLHDPYFEPQLKGNFEDDGDSDNDDDNDGNDDDDDDNDEDDYENDDEEELTQEEILQQISKLAPKKYMDEMQRVLSDEEIASLQYLSEEDRQKMLRGGEEYDPSKFDLEKAMDEKDEVSTLIPNPNP